MRLTEESSNSEISGVANTELSSLLSSSVENKSSTAATLSKARKLLYLSHLFSQFSEVAWQFCLVLFLAAFANYESFFLVSTYGILSGLFVCLTGSKAGKFIDDENRLFVAQTFIWTENLAVLGATLCCYALLSRDTQQWVLPPREEDQSGAWSEWFAAILEGVPVDAVSVLLLAAIHVLGSVAKVLDRGFIVAIERDWIVVMSLLASSSTTPGGDTVRHGEDLVQKTWLSRTNVALKQIDLSCKVVAPALAGFFVAAFGDGTGANSASHGGDLKGAALLVGALNASALVVEYVCTKRIYELIPDLAVKSVSNKNNGPAKSRAKDTRVCMEEGTEALETSELKLGTETRMHMEKAGTPHTACSSFSSSDEGGDGRKNRKYFGDGTFFRVPNGLKVYMAQPISSAGLALALLYLNILTFGAIMTAYLVWRGMRLQTIGIWRGVSSAVGLLGTVVFHYSATYLTLEQTGMWSILFQFTSLSVSYASLFVDNYDASLSMLIAGVCTSRVGLWVFDIAITQLMQELIPEHARGTVGGVQQSLNSFFELLTFVLGILFPDPRYFYVLVFAGYASVGVAMTLFAFGVFAKRDKLH